MSPESFNAVPTQPTPEESEKSKQEKQSQEIKGAREVLQALIEARADNFEEYLDFAKKDAEALLDEGYIGIAKMTDRWSEIKGAGNEKNDWDTSESEVPPGVTILSLGTKDNLNAEAVEIIAKETAKSMWIRGFREYDKHEKGMS